MEPTVEEVISALRAHFEVDSDAELARKLMINKSTVSSWRARGSVPQRFRGILSGEPHQFMHSPPLQWGEDEQAAFSLALFRFSRLVAAKVELEKYRDALTLFGGRAFPAFWIMMSAAQKDLAERRGNHTLSTLLALLIHDDLADDDASLTRDSERLAQVFPLAGL